MTSPADDERAAARIFMSYHKRNAALAKSIVESIRVDVASHWPNGPHAIVWFDEALQGGDKWDPEIEVQLELADIILFLITPACLEAGYMWSDEFPIALDRYRSGEGRVRLVPILYSDDLAPIRTHRYTRGLNCIPSKPHDQMADGWAAAVTEGVRKLVGRVFEQRDPPMQRLVPALKHAQTALDGAQALFSQSAADGFFGPVLASDVHNILGAIEAAIGLGARERLRALSVWEPKLRTCFVRMRDALPEHSQTLRALRDAIDEVTTYSSEETIDQPTSHQTALLQPGTHEAVEQVRAEVDAARQVLAEMSAAPSVENPIEQEARAHTVDAGSRHASLAEALLDEPQIDAAALSVQISGVENVAQAFASTVEHLGDQASAESHADSVKLETTVTRAVQLTKRLVADGRSVRRSGEMPEHTKTLPEGQQDENEQGVEAPADQAGRFRIPLNLLDQSPPRAARIDADKLRELSKRIEVVLSEFGVGGEVLRAMPGPAVTLFEFELPQGVKSSRVMALSDDIARSIGVASARVAVIPGRNSVGIELPVSGRDVLRLRDVLGSAGFAGVQGNLPLALGETVDGVQFGADLETMPHLLIAGGTGSGKSVGINAMILSLLYQFTPEECRLILIDTKMLELSVYDEIPHLLHPVIVDPKKGVSALRWAAGEMERRYKMMAKVGARNIASYNVRVREAIGRNEQLKHSAHVGFDPTSGEPIYETRELPMQALPRIVLAVDELGDLMLAAGKQVESAMHRLTQLARPAGIHVILATQRPSADVVTGVLRANLSTRLVYKVDSKLTSRTVLGEQGAEQLLGDGDGLFMAGGGRLRRVHGALVTDQEVVRVVDWLKGVGAPQYDFSVTDPHLDNDAEDSSPELEDGEELYLRAVEIVGRDRKASTSYLQRRLSLGYNRAFTLIARMEREGLISEANAQGKRDILFGEQPMPRLARIKLAPPGEEENGTMNPKEKKPNRVGFLARLFGRGGERE